MSDLTATFQEFAKYVRVIKSRGRNPNEDDVDRFLNLFLDDRRFGWFEDQATLINTRAKRLPDGKAVYDASGKSHADMMAELKPALMSKVVETFGAVSNEYGPYEWETTPMTVDEYALMYATEMGKRSQYEKLSGRDRLNHPAYEKAVHESQRIRFRIKEYQKTVLPFTLRMTMHHPIGAVLYSMTGKPISKPLTRNDAGGERFVLHTEEDLQEYMNSKTVDGFPAADHDGLRSIFWEPSNSGQYLKMAVIDIDNPANLTHEKLMKVTKKIYNRIAFDLEHPSIIMFTGASYQIWFGQNEREYLESYRAVNDYLKTVLFDYGAFNREDAIERQVPFIDLGTNGAGSPIRSFFSLHYPANERKTGKPYTGLAAVPVALTDLETFVPTRDAHPEVVLANFDIYSSFVANFYDRVKIGQDHESPGETERTPECIRLEERHPDASVLNAIYKEKDLIQVEYRNAGARLEGEKKVYAHPISRGILAVLVFDPRGTSLLPGMAKKKRQLSSNKVVLEKPKAYYILSNGVVIYDDYICRDFERVCIAKGINQAVLVGRISMIDAFGQEEGETETRNALLRPDGILSQNASVMRFAINRASMVNGKSIPIEIMGEQIKEFTAKRIVPTAYFEFDAPVGQQVKSKFMSLLQSRMSGSMMIEGENKYLLKSTRTMYATILGIDTSGKAYQSGADMPPAIIGLAKPSSKHGVEYIMVGKAEIALKGRDRMLLRQLVEGEEKRNLIPLPRGTPNGESVMIAEPNVVVEVAYDDITPQRFRNFTFFFTSEGRFRPTPEMYATNRVVNAKIIKIKENLDHTKPSNISVRQDELIEVSRRITKEESLLEAIPNPSSPIPEVIRRNSAFFGVPETMTTYVGGVKNEDGSGMSGGRKVEIPLIRPTGRGLNYLGEQLPPELGKAYLRGLRNQDGYKVFVDAKTLVKKDTPPNYRVTNLGGEYNIAVDDRFGLGQDGNSVTTMSGPGGSVGRIQYYSDAMEVFHLQGNRLQALEDAKVLAYTARDFPESEYTEEMPDSRAYDRGYIEALEVKDKTLRSAMTPGSITKEISEEYLDSIMTNPRPVMDDFWNQRIDEYVEEFNKWAALPEPKEDWERYAIGKFLSWEAPLLEKERMLRMARAEYDLTEEEVNKIDSQFAPDVTEDYFSLSLSVLYEVPDDDEEAWEAD